MLSILITNDDGIASDGLVRLARAAQEFGEVWAVAPDGQRSAASHAITLHGTVDIFPADFPVEGVHAFSCSGTPADCVRTGALSVMPHKPDVVISGINNGLNTATDIQYSGTCGAAFEGAFQGILSIALSEDVHTCREVTDLYLSRLLRELISSGMPGQSEIYNVNFPACPLSELKGILYDRRVSDGMFYKDSYKTVEELPGGGVRLVVSGALDKKAEEGSDLRAVIENYISVGKAKNIS
ncbi:MAG: 5'/3'-nucleotidase SurE [Ruminococcus sp.]|nr:5'/3'-nucleotidase SurE [Ruminococcus sp.]